MKKVLIFGMGGFAGKYLADEFKDNGYTVYGCDLIKTNSIADYVSFSECNICNYDEVYRAIKAVEPEYIVNLAAVSSVGLSWKKPQDTVNVNVIGALNILEASKNCNMQSKILLIGSSEEYEVSDKPISESYELNANNPYGISKMVQEQFAELYRSRYDMKVYYVRAFNHTGIGQSESFVIPGWCKQAAEISNRGVTGVIRTGNLNVKRDFSNVKDIVRAYRLVIESDDCETVYNIGSGKAVALKEIIEYISSLVECDMTIEVDEKLIRPTDNPYICCDSRLIKKKLGWKPEIDIFSTVNDMFLFYSKIKGV